jgi:two-component system OmpR family sensor kinase/two-component system sensor histidine kinase QseC
LVDNALKFSPDGAPVTVTVRDTTLEVGDRGTGIAPEDRERVFDRFYRHAAGDEPGTGLGLAIVRSVAQQHGASVTLGDSPLGGLRVVVRFSRDVSTPP